MCKKSSARHIPQDGAKLRELREARSHSQTDIANHLQAFLKPYMKPGFTVQQPDISRLECEDSAVDVLKLLGYSHLFGVDVDFLLKPHFRSLRKNAFRLQHFSQDTEADSYLHNMENAGRILAYSKFPSSFFVSPHQESTRFQQIAQADYRETHIHTLDSLLTFIFSPVSHYSYAQRHAILRGYLEHFRHKHAKHLYFFARAHFPATSLFPNLVLLPEKFTLLMLAPVMQPVQGDIFLEIQDEHICQEVRDFYFHKVKTLDADITLLKIGRDTLELLQGECDMKAAVRHFYEETLKRSPEDSKLVLENFSPDMWEMLWE
ncbi:MAG: helix-turn-helix transcriptional regulator [Thiothrix sp.]